ncbi:MAG TPA: hypothetical protein VER39_06915 [Nocardioidaceae bacterium]|nr:hypothetical protein [Nocardioidaceae bacterium]
MNRTDSSTDVDTRSTQTTLHPGCSGSTNCRCGQQLDVCARDHCPRCGRTLHRR